jgi:hypothetical protein
MNLVAIPLKQATRRHTERFSWSELGLFDKSRTEDLADGNRFYFHVGNGCRYPDKTGTVFPTAEDAVAHPSFLLGNLRKMRIGTGALSSSRMTWESKFAVYGSIDRMPRLA